MSKDGTFPVRFPNIFVDYPLGQMRVGDRTWTNWNKAPMQLWQTQLNFAVWCSSSACGVSSAHLNYYQKNRSANKARGFHQPPVRKRHWTLVCKQSGSDSNNTPSRCSVVKTMIGE